MPMPILPPMPPARGVDGRAQWPLAAVFLRSFSTISWTGLVGLLVLLGG